jgi:3-phosphoshikimate 1-carboxyvinyltransferase
MLDVPFHFSGLQSLRIKETDRLEALKTELARLGRRISVTGNGILEWNGERCVPATDDPLIHTYEDHRMAMAFAPAALVLPRGIRIADPGVVSKSYPRFWEDLQAAGFVPVAEEK